MRLNNFGAGGNIFTKLLQTTCREAGVIICVQLLEGLPPKIWEGHKNIQISARFLTTFDFDPEYLRNWSTYRTFKKTWSTATPSTLDKRNLVNFGLQTKKFYRCILSHPSEHFSGDYISAIIGGTAPQIFIHARDWARLHIAHTTAGTGVPPNVNREN